MKKENEQFDEFVPLLFARNLAEAEFYKTLLEDHGIQALIEDENIESMGLADLTRGVPVLVPDHQLEDAEAVINDRENISELMGEEDAEEDESEEDLGEFNEFDPGTEKEEIGGDSDMMEEDDIE